MTIQSAKWTESGSIDVTDVNGTIKNVPDSMGNRDRRELDEWEQEGNTIEPYVAPPKYPTKAAAIQAAIDFAQSFTEGVTGPVPLDEKLSWDAKEAAAKAFIAGTATAEQQSLLDDEAALMSEETADLANVIVSKAAIYRKVVSRVAGLRRALTAQIEAEADPYKYEAILVAGQAQAQQLAESLGVS